MFNALNDGANPEYFAKITPRERLNRAVDAAHAEMTAYQAEPHLSPERRSSFLRFLARLEEMDQAAREYPVAHSNRVKHAGRGA